MARFALIPHVPVIARWARNAKVRADLASLSSRAVIDLGLDLDAVRAEAARPFWRPLTAHLAAPNGDDPALTPSVDPRYAEVLAAAEQAPTRRANDDRADGPSSAAVSGTSRSVHTLRLAS
jgi:uncharacterized protein YjiS (DUF1127 family)